jgi:glycosyltransferase involved in cell wall biosynthesis
MTSADDSADRARRASAPGTVVGLVVVPGPDAPFAPLVDALRRWHPTWHLRVVWAGDPQLSRSFVAASSAEVVGPGVTELELVAVDPVARPLLVGLRAVDDRPTVVLVAGSVAVLGPIDAVTPLPGRLTVVPRVLSAAGGDGAPELAELGRSGMSSTSVIALGAGSVAIRTWMTARLLDADPAPAGVVVDLAADVFDGIRCTDDRVGASVWRWSDDRPVLVEAPGHDPSRPWLLDPDLDGPPRVSLADPARRAVMSDAAIQLGPGPGPLRLPGGIVVDAAIRAIARRDPPDGALPWSDAARFRAHVSSRYWLAARARRPDLRFRFASPGGADAAAFADWARHAAFVGDAPLLLDPSGLGAGAEIRRTGERLDGVDVVGYFHHQSGVADVARRIADVLGRHGVPHTTVAHRRTENPLLHTPPTTDQELRYATSIVVVNGDQVTTLRDDVPELFGPGRRVVGVWFWELETLAGAAPVGDHLVDEIWSATTFMATAFRGLDSAPVRVVPLPFRRPEPDGRPRRSFAPLAGADGRFVFGVVFDHLSVTSRKNPLGAIEAFRRAFAPDEGPLLVVKSINGDRCWHEHERLLAASADRDDIVVWDRHLSQADHDAFVGSLDALVSLHRSEGLGLHLAAAMSVGVPVIATRYSGNLDFMDDGTALLVDADLVPVGDDGGWAYPSSARWAEPRVDQAVAAMRRAASGDAARLAAAARPAIDGYATEAEFVAVVRDLIRSGPDRSR